MIEKRIHLTGKHLLSAMAAGEQSPKLNRTVSQQLSGIFGAPGTDMSEFLPDRGLIMRHGSSLQLMALVSECLNESDEFGEIDPSADWQKWSERRPDFSLYYAALVNPAHDGEEGVVCVLRAVMDGIPTPVPPHRPRLIIDYVTTRVAARGEGLASLLVNFVVEASQIFGASTYVLAIEDSCVYWMSKGFVLEDGANLNARLNIFSDTHLLRLSTDPPDPGAKEDLALQVEEEEEEGGDGDDDDDEEMGEDEAFEGEDQDLKAAMQLSLASAAPADSIDADLQKAMELSMADDQHPRSAVGPSLPASIASDSAAEAEEAELQRALAMSMQEQ
eukprot:TRINITY_DN43332_c0_g1_i1.p1 TRINITY_DN43332_c0_g1~~TRINITY_DN43332_c0_g1_i1.p1  ORF type:complete len:332 (+),score=75.65 TRINITY_DN43332_c0_g1_i1:33-1028(+)